LQNIAYFGICFLLGLILVGIKGFVVKLRLKKEIKTKDATVASLKEQVNTLKTELEVFQHDPYIKKELEEKTIVDLPVPSQPENDNEKGDKSGAAD
ncbi:MAG: LapA family protein, partial [Desulfobacula sp.]|nr:LapA family protein [Desulfobacula sp.]